MANAQNRLQALATEEARKKLPKELKPQGSGYTSSVDQYFVQEYMKNWNLLGTRPRTPEMDQFESAREDSQDESTDTDSGSTGSKGVGTTTRMETDHTVWFLGY